MTRTNRARLVTAVALFLVVAIAGPVTAAPTKRQTEIDQQIAALKDELQEASHEEEALAVKVAQAESRRRLIDDRIASLDAEISTVQKDVDVAQVRLDETSAQVLAAQNQLSQARAALAAAKDELQKRALAAYMGQPELKVASARLQPSSDREYAATEGYLHAIVTKQQVTVARFRRLKVQADELEAKVEQQRDQARVQRDFVAQQATELERVKSEQEAARQEAAAEEGVQTALMNEAKAIKEKASAQIAQLKAESDSITAYLRRSQTGGGSPLVGRGILAYPIPGARITSTFGLRVHPIFGDARMHTGVDFAAGMGTPIRASADGIVLSAGDRGGYGNVTLIDHGGSLATMYCHQSSFAVVPGQRVSRGQVIGYVGSTGFSTGPHLHFEARLNGAPVDPMQYV